MEKHNCLQCAKKVKGTKGSDRNRIYFAKHCSKNCKNKFFYKKHIKRFKAYNKLLTIRNRDEWFEMRDCMRCRKEFAPHTRFSKFCSVKCSASYYKHLKAFKWKEERYCGICKGNFIPINISQIFCSERCQYKHERGRFKNEVLEKKCRVCKKLFQGKIKVKYCSIKCRRKFDYLNNRDKKISYNIQYAKDNRKKSNGWKRKWSKNNPEKVIHNRKQYIYRKKGAGGKFTRNEWIELKNRIGNKCMKCGKLESEIELTADHIIPIKRWKIWRRKNNVDYKCNDIQNIQPLCRSCNSSKSSIIIN